MNVNIVLVAGIGLVILAVIIATSYGAGSKGDKELASDINSIQTDLNNGSLLLDVRTPEEYAGSHINGAQNFPLSDIQNGSYPKTEKSKRLYSILPQRQ